MVNGLPPPTQTIVIYRCCEPSRWGISHKYDFYIERAINLLYRHYDDLPDDIRQHLILELVKTRNTNDETRKALRKQCAVEEPAIGVR